jgi:hypothetical protein
MKTPTQINYKNYLTVDSFDKPGTRITKVKKTESGYNVQMFNNYITLYYLKIFVNSNGSAKITWKIDKNYNPIQRFTTYYNYEGFETDKKTYFNLNK